MSEPVAHRPFALLGADVLRVVPMLLEPVLSAWCTDWGVANDALVLETQRAWEAVDQLPAVPAWRSPWRSAEGSMALAWPADLPVQLQRVLFASERSAVAVPGQSIMALAVAEAAWLALLAALATAVLPDSERGADAGPPPSAAWRVGSGALLLVIRLGRHACHMLLDHGAVQALVRQATLRGRIKAVALPSLPELAYDALLAPLAVLLPVELGRAEVDLGSLLKLEVGDVIRLDTPADQAICVRTPTGAVLFDGYLGMAAGQVALELTRHDLIFGEKQ